VYIFSRVVCDIQYGQSATSVLQALHWLPTTKRITYKIATITHRTLHTQQPTYVPELVHVSEPTRLLRWADRLLLDQPRSNTAIASRAFSVAAPKIWNSLPPSITACDNYCTFKSKLKTYLFTTYLTNQRLCIVLSTNLALYICICIYISKEKVTLMLNQYLFRKYYCLRIFWQLYGLAKKCHSSCQQPKVSPTILTCCPREKKN